MQCSKCGNEQNVGKFCGNCGGVLIAKPETPIESSEKNLVEEKTVGEHKTPEAVNPVESSRVEFEVSSTQENAEPVSSNDSMKKIKETSRQYSTYFMEYLKFPTLIFSKRRENINNGMISIGLISIILSLSLYFLARSFFSPYVTYGFSDGAPFFSIFFSSFLIIIFSILINVSVLFIVNKLFGSDYSFGETLSIYGAHMSPALILSVLALILAILKSHIYGSVTIYLSIILVLGTIPIYLMNRLLAIRPKAIDPLYAYFIYIILIGICYVIFFGIILDTTIGNILDNLWF